MYKIPKKIRYKGVIYDVNAKHSNVIKILDWLDDPTLDDIDRANMLITRLFGLEAPVEQPLIEVGKQILMLDRPEAEHKQQVRDMDFIHDYQRIRMDLIRDYGVDIAKEDVDWDWFFYAIESLGEDSSLHNIRKLRTMKLSEVSAKERQKLKEAKKQVELPTPHADKIKEERDKIKKQQDNILKKLL